MAQTRKRNRAPLPRSLHRVQRRALLLNLHQTTITLTTIFRFSVRINIKARIARASLLRLELVVVAAEAALVVVLIRVITKA